MQSLEAKYKIMSPIEVALNNTNNLYIDSVDVSKWLVERWRSLPLPVQIVFIGGVGLAILGCDWLENLGGGPPDTSSLPLCEPNGDLPNTMTAFRLFNEQNGDPRLDTCQDIFVVALPHYLSKITNRIDNLREFVMNRYFQT